MPVVDDVQILGQAGPGYRRACGLIQLVDAARLRGCRRAVGLGVGHPQERAVLFDIQRPDDPAVLPAGLAVSVVQRTGVRIAEVIIQRPHGHAVIGRGARQHTLIQVGPVETHPQAVRVSSVIQLVDASPRGPRLGWKTRVGDAVLLYPGVTGRIGVGHSSRRVLPSEHRAVVRRPHLGILRVPAAAVRLEPVHAEVAAVAHVQVAVIRENDVPRSARTPGDAAVVHRPQVRPVRVVHVDILGLAVGYVDAAVIIAALILVHSYAGPVVAGQTGQRSR